MDAMGEETQMFRAWWDLAWQGVAQCGGAWWCVVRQGLVTRGGA